jgi:hypothetical protein
MSDERFDIGDFAFGQSAFDIVNVQLARSKVFQVRSNIPSEFWLATGGVYAAMWNRQREASTTAGPARSTAK